MSYENPWLIWDSSRGMSTRSNCGASIFVHFVGDDRLDFLQSCREWLQLNNLAVLDANVVRLVPVGWNVKWLLTMNQKIEAANALQERQVADSGSDLSHHSLNLSLNFLQLLRRCHVCWIEFVWVLILIWNFSLNFKVPALKNFLSVNIWNNQRELLYFVCSQPLYESKLLLALNLLTLLVTLRTHLQLVQELCSEILWFCCPLT